MNCNWKTPQGLLKALSYVYKFTLDPTPLDPCPKFDGLSMSWKNERVFLNPPYDKKQLPKFIEKSIHEDVQLLVALLPAKTDTKWFHCMMNSKKFTFVFLSGRLSFGDKNGRAPFPSMIAVRENDERKKVQRLGIPHP